MIVYNHKCRILIHFSQIVLQMLYNQNLDKKSLFITYITNNHIIFITSKNIFYTSNFYYLLRKSTYFIIYFISFMFSFLLIHISLLLSNFKLTWNSVLQISFFALFQAYSNKKVISATIVFYQIHSHLIIP